VGIDGTRAEVQASRDRPVGQSVGDELAISCSREVSTSPEAVGARQPGTGARQPGAEAPLGPVGLTGVPGQGHRACGQAEVVDQQQGLVNGSQLTLPATATASAVSTAMAWSGRV
jgi:hypothetical protein